MLQTTAEASPGERTGREGFFFIRLIFNNKIILLNPQPNTISYVCVTYVFCIGVDTGLRFGDAPPPSRTDVMLVVSLMAPRKKKHLKKNPFFLKVSFQVFQM